MCAQTCFPISQESALCVKSPGERHTPTDGRDMIPETVSSPSRAALQSGAGSWDLVWYADWAQGTAMWQRSMLFDGSLFIVLCSHVFIQLIQLIPDDLSLAPPAYMALFRRGSLGLIREHSQISPDCCEALIDERENISLPRNHKMVGVNMHACVPVVCLCVPVVCLCVSVSVCVGLSELLWLTSCFATWRIMLSSLYKTAEVVFSYRILFFID